MRSRNQAEGENCAVVQKAGKRPFVGSDGERASSGPQPTGTRLTGFRAVWYDSDARYRKSRVPNLWKGGECRVSVSVQMREFLHVKGFSRRRAQVAGVPGLRYTGTVQN